MLDALEAAYPMLRGTVRDQDSGRRRPFIRFFACEEDLSHEEPDTLLPEAVATGAEPYLIVGAMAVPGRSPRPGARSCADRARRSISLARKLYSV